MPRGKPLYTRLSGEGAGENLPEGASEKIQLL